jgi:hypothetical protein
MSTSEYSFGPVPNEFLMCDIPSGAQMQIRGKCSGTAEALDFVVALGW